MPVILSGPFFEASTRARVMNEITAEIEKDVAQVGHAYVKTNLVTFIRRPTPFYWTRTAVRGNPAGPGLSIWDNYVVYGPWLEGNGSRNRTTRFKGYASFRRSAQALERVAGAIGQRAVDRKIGGLN